MIIDGHAHTYPDYAAARVIKNFTDYHHMVPTDSLGRGTVNDILTEMKKSCINYTVTANFAPGKSIIKTNEWTLASADDHPSLIPLISVCPGMSIDLVKKYFDTGAKGVKMHTGIQGFEPADPGLDEIYSFCEKHNIPVTFHCGETSRVHMNEYAEMSHIMPTVKAYPGVTFVLTHLAAGNPETVLQIAGEFQNVLFDTSIAFSGEHCIHRIHDNIWENDEKTAALFREIGCNRIAFGSDYPFGNPVADIRRLKRLDLTEEEKNMILGINTARIYCIL